MWQFNRFGVILRVVSAISIIFIGATPTDGACNPQFVDQSDVFTSESINGVVAGWMDFDGDGDEDFLFWKGAICPDPFGCSSPRVKVFRNEGGLALVDVTDDLFGSAPLGSHGMAWGDMDNDGDLDLFLPLKRSLPPPFFSNELWRNDGNEFVEIALPPIRNVVDPLYAAWIDYDNDGLLDLYLGGEVNRFHRNLGDSTFEEGPPLPETIDGASGMAWGDFDGDGDLDLLRTSALSTNTLYRNDGEGVFSVVSSQPIEDPGRSSSACWGDYDGDGDLDLVVGNGRLDSDPPEDGGDRLLRNDGSGVFSDVTPPELADTKDTQSIRWVDFDNDGDLDLSILYE